MLEQALANVMNLGLNCRQVTGPVCLPSSNATFKPLSAFHTWIFPSSEPIHKVTENNQKTIEKSMNPISSISIPMETTCVHVRQNMIYIIRLSHEE